MKKIILLAITCFFVNQASALGPLTIINGTSSYDLYIQAEAVNFNSCYPSITTYDFTVYNNYYLAIGPQESRSSTNFVGFLADYPGLKYSIKTSATAPYNEVLPAQAQAYASLVNWSFFLFKAFDQNSSDAVGGYVGLGGSISCHGTADYAVLGALFASTFTIGAETYYVIS